MNLLTETISKLKSIKDGDTQSRNGILDALSSSITMLKRLKLEVENMSKN